MEREAREIGRKKEGKEQEKRGLEGKLEKKSFGK